MSPLTSQKNFVCFFIDSVNSIIIDKISEELEKEENVLILFSEKNEDFQNIERDLKRKFWKKVGHNKLHIMVVPEINLLYISEKENIKLI